VPITKPGFEVATDNAHRILHFIPEEHPRKQIQPENMGAYLDGGERLVHEGQEYDLTDEGGLIHPDVEVPDSAIIGPGVLLEEGVKFVATRARTGHEVAVRARARLRDSKLYPGVDIGSSAVVLGSTIGPGTDIGEFAVIRQGVTIGKDVMVGDSVKIDQESQLDDDVDVDFATNLGFRTILRAGVVIGEECLIGKTKGRLLREGEFEEDIKGVLIVSGNKVPSGTTVLKSITGVKQDWAPAQ
jgi:UDP-3-O-[3-hydroxymyristoyl] glucosamine N-acyltransferase